MKKVIAVLCVICICLCFIPFQVASADALSTLMVGAAAYAIMADAGISISGWGLTSETTSSFMQGQINDYLTDSGQSMLEAFGSQEMRNVAGKLAIGQELYNGISGFLDWLVSKYDLSDSSTSLESVVDGQEMPISSGATSGTGPNRITFNEGWWNQINVYFYWNNDFKTSIRVSRPSGYDHVIIKNAQLQITGAGSNNGYCFVEYQARGNYTGGEYTKFVDLTANSTITISYSSGYDIFGSLSEDYVQPTVLNPSKEWVGQLGGQDWPDTNIDQLIGQIYQDVADTNLEVEGEIIDVGPVPTPVPTWAPVDDVIDGINGLGEELDGIGNDIGDISGHLDDIGDQIGDVTGALEGVQEGIQTQTGVISGAMDQAAQDVAVAIGSQTAALDESLTATAEGIQDITEALTAPEIDARTFDLRELFPFCIPFDIYHLLQKFDGTPTAPHVQIPIVIPSIGFSYTLDLDFSVWDPVAAAMRTVELIVYALGLAWATSKVIKW